MHHESNYRLNYRLLAELTPISLQFTLNKTFLLNGTFLQMEPWSIGIYVPRTIKIISLEVLVPQIPGPTFTKGLSRVLGLNVQRKCTTFKLKFWLSFFMNTSPGPISQTDLS